MNIIEKKSNVLVSEGNGDTTRDTYKKYVAFENLASMRGYAEIQHNTIDVRLTIPQSINIDSASSLLMQALRATEPYMAQILCANGKTIAQNAEASEEHITD